MRGVVSLPLTHCLRTEPEHTPWSGTCLKPTSDQTCWKEQVLRVTRQRCCSKDAAAEQIGTGHLSPAREFPPLRFWHFLGIPVRKSTNCMNFRVQQTWILMFSYLQCCLTTCYENEDKNISKVMTCGSRDCFSKWFLWTHQFELNTIHKTKYTL